MEIYSLRRDVTVFGFRVKDFPAGIGAAYDLLVQNVAGGFDRPYFGIAYTAKDGTRVYKATAQEKYEGEAQKYSYERYTIEKGAYLAVTVYDWRNKTGSIKDVFQEIMKDNRVDKTKPCIECYKNDQEMVCMVQTLTTT
ncbi:MAG: hypothetical protein ABI416_10915 [Ginsengibacter sp.]